MIALFIVMISRLRLIGSKTNMKKLLIIIAIIIVGGIAYVTFTKNGTPASTGPLTSSAPASTLPSTDDQIGREFLSILLSLKTIGLNDELFRKPAFQNLRDYTTELMQTDQKGRPNPFAPIGTDIGSITIADPGVSIGANAGSATNTTTPTTPVVTSLPADQITRAGARISGTVASGVVATARWLEFGTTPALGTRTPNIATSAPFSFTLTTLSANTTYYSRACAVVAASPLCGEVVNWKTLP